MLVKTSKMYIDTYHTYDISRHSVATTNRWVHTRHIYLTAPRQYRKKSHGVQTTIVEKADAGTLGRHLGSLGWVGINVLSVEKYPYTIRVFN